VKRKIDPALQLLAARTENDVKRECLAVLELYGFPAFRQNTGGMFDKNKQFVRFAFKGCSDILAVIKGPGRWFCVETKRPVKPTPLTVEQRAFLELINACGGVGVCVSDPQHLVSICMQLQNDPLARFDIKGGRL
jgi:hypothetical protein